MNPTEITELIKRLNSILGKFDENYNLPIDEEPKVKQIMLEAMSIFEDLFGSGNTYFVHIQHDYYDNLGGLLGSSVSHACVTGMMATLKAAEAEAIRKSDIKEIHTMKEFTAVEESHQEIFISHASKDKFIVDEFVDVILDNGMGILRSKIFCTSVEGMGVTSGDDFRESIRKSTRDCRVAILLTTPNNKTREICLNEMGAAWSLGCRVIACIVECGSDFTQVGVLLNPRQAENLLVETDLDDLKEAIEKEIKISQVIPQATWTTQKKKFISRVASYLKDNPYPNVVTEVEFQKLKMQKRENEAVIARLVEENRLLRKMNAAIKLAKDKKEVESIEEIHSDESEMELFKQHIKEVRDSLEIFNPVVNAFIFREISGKKLRIDYTLYDSEISEAIAEEYLADNGEEINVNWDSTNVLEQVRKSINNLDEFLKLKPREKLFDWHLRKYGFNPDISNLDFWRIIGINIKYK